MRRLIVQDKVSIGRAPGARCDVCGSATREHKAVCSDHIFTEPYVSRLVDILAESEKEVEMVASQGAAAINLDGLIVGEVLAALLVNGTLTWQRIVKDFVPNLTNASLEVTDAYLHAIQESGLVSIRYSHRRIPFLSLNQEGLQKAMKK